MRLTLERMKLITTDRLMAISKEKVIFLTCVDCYNDGHNDSEVYEYYKGEDSAVKCLYCGKCIKKEVD